MRDTLGTEADTIGPYDPTYPQSYRQLYVRSRRRSARRLRNVSPHTYAASECWMSIEKSHPKMDLDKRYAIVAKCIDDKMKATR